MVHASCQSVLTREDFSLLCAESRAKESPWLEAWGLLGAIG